MRQLIRGDYFEVDGPDGVDIVPLSVMKGTFAEIRDSHDNAVKVPRALRPHCKNTLCWSARKKTGWIAKGTTGPWAGFEGKHAKTAAIRFLEAEPGAL